MISQDPLDGIAKDELTLGKKCHGGVFNVNENGLYRDLHASEVSIVKDSVDKSDLGVVLDAKPIDQPPDLVPRYNNNKEWYNAQIAELDDAA